ncbi:MAG: hypothetical protein LH606_15860 [Cytophagaceae bacterium]|nr:hypothetical protein [Cytophagaceae bacterium]
MKTYDILKNRFSEAEAATLIEYVETKAEQTVNQKKDVFATKEGIYKLETKLTEAKSDIIKWMFLSWIGQTAAVLAIVKLL